MEGSQQAPLLTAGLWQQESKHGLHLSPAILSNIAQNTLFLSSPTLHSDTFQMKNRADATVDAEEDEEMQESLPAP